MLYETLNQPSILLIFLITGLLSGLVFDVGNFVKFLCSNKKVPKVILDFIETFFILCIFFKVNLQFNYGVFRFFPIIIFLLSFTIERFTIGKLVAKFYLSCYNCLTKLNKLLWRKLKNGKTKKTD